MMKRVCFVTVLAACAWSPCYAGHRTVTLDTGDKAHPGAENLNNIFTFSNHAGGVS